MTREKLEEFRVGFEALSRSTGFEGYAMFAIFDPTLGAGKQGPSCQVYTGGSPAPVAAIDGFIRFAQSQGAVR